MKNKLTIDLLDSNNLFLTNWELQWDALDLMTSTENMSDILASISDVLCQNVEHNVWENELEI